MPEHKKKAIYFTRFEYSPDAGGGCRRFSQVLTDLNRNYDVKIVSTRDKEDYSRATNSVHCKESIIEWSTSYGAVDRYLLMGEYWANHIDLSPYSVVFLDDPVYFSNVLAKSRSLGTPVVGICHNLETLADGQVNSGKIINAFKTELEVLALLDLAITISYEETFVLTNIGINAFFYPYYPVECIEERLKAIRQARDLKLINNESTETSGIRGKKKQILFFGSLGNLPTKIGLERLLTVWTDLDVHNETGYELLVTGFGSEQYYSYDSKLNGINILGPLNKSDLDNKLSEVELVIVYQGKGSGALTKINETLIAGVTIIANQHAARSYTNLNGVLQYSNDFHDLIDVLGEVSRSPQPKQIWPIPKPNHTDLFFAIESLLG